MQKLFVCALFAASSVVWAQNTVYVSGSGSDSNSCTTTAQPCRTMNGAVSKAGNGGLVMALDASDFGAVSITHAITIDGGAHGAFLSGTGLIISVNLPAFSNAPVILRNLSLVAQVPGGSFSSVTGVDALLNGGSLYMDHIAISLQTPSLGSNQGIYIAAATGVRVDLQNITITGVSRGIDVANIAATPTAPIVAALLNVSVAASEIGMDALEASVTVRDSSFRGGLTALGFYANQTTPSSLVEHTEMTNSGTGLSVSAKGTVRLSNSILSGNTTGISSAGTVISYRNNTFAGNGTDGAPSLSVSLK